MNKWTQWIGATFALATFSFYPITALTSHWLSNSEHSVWAAMSNRFELLSPGNMLHSRKQISWFKKNPDYLAELGRNATPYLYYMMAEAEKRGMPAEVALMPMIESNYNPFEYSKRGATGLWQMMPGTASGFGLAINWWYDGRRDLTHSTQAALDYLSYLHSYLGDWLLAMAAYDAGEGTIKNAIAYNKKHGRPTDFWSLSLPKETQNYIPKLIALASLIKYDETYEIHWSQIPNQPYLVAVHLDTQMNMDLLAKLAQIKPEAIEKLNPGFRRFATPLTGNYTLMLPIDKAAIFEKHFAELDKTTLITWFHHVVKPNETLASIATQHDTNVDILKKVNGLAHNTLRAKQNLLVPFGFQGNNHLTAKLKKPQAKITEDNIPGPQSVHYIVTKNDSLSHIAKLYHVSSNDIAYWNQFHNNTHLTPGKKLIIWTRKA